jgi:hypothetical protein
MPVMFLPSPSGGLEFAKWKPIIVINKPCAITVMQMYFEV